MRLMHLSGRKICERVKTRGSVWKGKHMHARWLAGAPRGVRVPSDGGLFLGTLASAKLHKSAVVRNRMRRRCREAIRLAISATAAPPVLACQLLLLPRSSSLSAPFPELLADASVLLSFLSSSRARSPLHPLHP